MNRVDRLVAILTTLQSRKYVKVEFIADKFAISLRTVYRDLKALGEIGVPIYFENQKGYTILKEFFLPPINLTNEEANAIILVAALSQKFTDKTTQNNIGSALSKIKAVLRNNEKDKADFLQSQIKVYKPLTEADHSDFLGEIQQAIIDKQALEITYTNNKEVYTKREVEPIGLTFYSNQWHLIAWCWLRNGYRDFKVNRIGALASNGKPFSKKDCYDINEYIRSLQ